MEMQEKAREAAAREEAAAPGPEPQQR